MPQHPLIAQLHNVNKQWASDVINAEPEFFEESAKGQKPAILWFGCSDSRVPESVVLAVKPGEVFVHRNIANQFHLDDDSANAVLSFAVESVGVEHVVVVGHTNCGGCKGVLGFLNDPDSLTPIANTPLGRWLTPLKKMGESLNVKNMPEAKAMDVLVHESVRRQVENIVSTAVIQRAWQAGKQVHVHGWVYHLEKGRLEDMDITYDPPSQKK